LQQKHKEAFVFLDELQRADPKNLVYPLIIAFLFKHLIKEPLLADKYRTLTERGYLREQGALYAEGRYREEPLAPQCWSVDEVGGQ